MGVEIENAIKRFKLSENWKILTVAGALDGSHITIVASDNENKVDQFRGDLIFLSVATGYPGNLHDSRGLRNSDVFHRAENIAILNVATDVIEKKEMPPLLIADSAYVKKI